MGAPADTAELSLYIEACEIAEVIGWTSYRTQNLLRDADVLLKRGRRWVVTRHQLREAFPEVYDELRDRLLARREAEAASGMRRAS